MADTPSLLQQLANRDKLSNYSSFLSGKRGISAEATCQLVELMALSIAILAFRNR